MLRTCHVDDPGACGRTPHAASDPDRGLLRFGELDGCTSGLFCGERRALLLRSALAAGRATRRACGGAAGTSGGDCAWRLRCQAARAASTRSGDVAQKFADSPLPTRENIAPRAPAPLPSGVADLCCMGDAVCRVPAAAESNCPCDKDAAACDDRPALPEAGPGAWADRPHSGAAADLAPPIEARPLPTTEEILPGNGFAAESCSPELAGAAAAGAFIDEPRTEDPRWAQKGVVSARFSP